VLALVAEDVKKTAPLAKACAKVGLVLQYGVEKRELPRWVASQLRARGVDAQPDACAALVQLVGEDLHALAQEIDKLATWAGGEPIGAEEVEELVPPSGDLPVYELTDAWAAGDAARALVVSEGIFAREPRQRRDTAARLAGALGGHVGRLRTLRRMADAGVSSKDAAAELKLNPYYARKLYGQAEGLSAEQLEQAVVRLAELDGALKGQSRLAPDLEVQRALVDLTRPPGAQAMTS
jgi:DNA polymerase III subunit delta